MTRLPSRFAAHQLVLAAFGLSTLTAQPPAVRPSAAPPTPSPAEVLKRVTWRSVGPANNAGRISVVVGVPGDPLTYYVAGANGAIIKTTNGGTTFKPIFDDQNSGSIGAIAIAPSDPNVIYVGTGEGNPRNNASVGDGMYKSIDGGETGRTSVSPSRTRSRAS